MNYIIRDARIEDAERLRAIARAAYAKYVSRIGREPAPMSADYAAAVEAGHAILVQRGAKIVGYLIGWRQDEAYVVENLAVDPAHQSEGFGRALLAEAVAHAHRLSLSALRLYTNAAMTENLDFYARQGFVETHRAVEEGYDRVYMRLAIRPANP